MTWDVLISIHNWRTIDNDAEAEAFVVEGLMGENYKMLALAQYRLSRQNGMTIEASIELVLYKIVSTATKVIDAYEAQQKS